MEFIEARSIFTPATGFIRRGGFDWTCNPYVGCVFGCTYCYAMFLPQSREPLDQWGRWLRAKQNAVEIAWKSRHRIAQAAVYLSSVTDPYQPIERSLLLTRGILEAMIDVQPRLLVQTRGPLVVRDVDLLAAFRHIRVNVSIPTDSDEVRQLFEPKAPPLTRRWDAMETLKSHGIPVGVCITPMLPIAEPERFADRLAEFQPEVLVVQSFHDSRGCFGADTGPKARELLHQVVWGVEEFHRVVDQFRRMGLRPLEGEAGFFPPGTDLTP